MSKRRKKTKPADRHSTRKGIYLLPNLFTTGSLFAAVYGLIATSQGRWQEAGLAVFASLILDGLDGKVARLTRATSRFGVEYDSLADLVAFGVVPAFLVHQWTLHSFGRLGWVAVALYVVCGALRLARFNIQVGSKDPRYFVGLPIPAAASILAVVVIGVEHFQIPTGQADIFLLVLIYLLSFLMVSTLPYRSLKEVALSRRRSFNLLVAGVLVFSLLAYRPVLMGIFFLMVYLASGPAMALFRLRARNRQQAGKAAEARIDPLEEH
ncbi:MAG: CDP-diacylglycerol--serine O-phosphatidyltransferase [Deltaproteobacteria bacterium]|nr:CDP-diacylglycerol--serine O-phosphatidyltransferase [Deltaproteobacteria bacterium]